MNMELISTAFVVATMVDVVSIVTVVPVVDVVTSVVKTSETSLGVSEIVTSVDFVSVTVVSVQFVRPVSVDESSKVVSTMVSSEWEGVVGVVGSVVVGAAVEVVSVTAVGVGVVFRREYGTVQVVFRFGGSFPGFALKQTAWRSRAKVRHFIKNSILDASPQRRPVPESDMFTEKSETY